MNFSEIISSKLTKVISNELDYNEDKKEVIAYAIETALLSFFGWFLIILLGYAFSALLSVVIAALFGGSLRRLSGGAHFKTPIKCLVVGSVIYSSIGVLANKLVDCHLINQYVLIFVLIISLLIVAFLAPVDSESKPIHSSSFKFKLKISSIIFVTVSLLIVLTLNNTLVSVSAVLGIFYQSITLLPIFNRKGGEYGL